MRTVFRSTSAKVAAGVLLVVAVLAVFGPLLAPQDPLAQNTAAMLQGPSAEHLARHRRARPRRAQPAPRRLAALALGRAARRRRRARARRRPRPALRLPRPRLRVDVAPAHRHVHRPALPRVRHRDDRPARQRRDAGDGGGRHPDLAGVLPRQPRGGAHASRARRTSRPRCSSARPPRGSCGGTSGGTCSPRSP